MQLRGGKVRGRALALFAVNANAASIENRCMGGWAVHRVRAVQQGQYNWQYGEYRQVPRIADCERIRVVGKHRYLYPLDKAMRKQIEPLRQPYPKRASEAKETARPAPSGETGGASPTQTLDRTNEFG